MPEKPPTRGGEYVKKLRLLARACGLQLAYRDMSGRLKRATTEELLAVLRAMCIDISDADEADAAMQALREERRKFIIEPVTIAWDGKLPGIGIKLAHRPDHLEAEILLETGDKRKYSLKDIVLSDPVSDSGRFRLRLPAGDRLPLGYHRLTVTADDRQSSSLVISAPRHVFTPAGGPKRWGLFCPLYALHSAASWGAGDLRDFRRLAEWSHSQGGNVIATLPLLPAFYKEHFNPSPYSPVSRLFWNEFFIDIDSIPEVEACAEAKAALRSAAFRADLDELKTAPLVDYARHMALKRRVLEPLAKWFFKHQDSGRFQAYSEYLAARPDLEDYARFRALSEELQTAWPDWPDGLRQGNAGDSDCRLDILRYHLYTQFIAHEQMANTTADAREINQAFYLDLPLGAHPDGYDVWRHRDIFALNASVGAPPDPAFPGGQDWGFPPPLPEPRRQSGYRYFIAVIRHHLRFAGILRLDHIMGLHRLFWIPRGLPPGSGVYVRYHPEEMYAILCLEAHRHRAVIVGEDLGLVPASVRQAMRRHHVFRSYVAQYQMVTEHDDCLDGIPPDAVAAANTHDMHPFAAFWQGTDIAERLEAGALSPDQAAAEGRQRHSGKASLVRCLRQLDLIGTPEPTAGEVYAAVCSVMAGSQAEVVLLSIDDLLGATKAQNIPGTHTQHPNWRRRAKQTLEEMQADRDLNAFLSRIDRQRKGLT